MVTMKKWSWNAARLGVAAAMLSVYVTQAGASMVIPVTGGQANTGGYNTFDRAFNSQPTSVPTVGLTAASGGSNYQLEYGAYRAGFVDFGTAYADIELTNVFVLINRYANGNNGTATYWWSNDKDKTFEAGEGDVIASNFDVFTTQGVSTVASNQWIQTWSGSEVVAQRYLIVGYTGGPLLDPKNLHSNGLGEIAFVGVIPEPASLALALCGGLLMLGRRTRKVA